MRLQTMERFVDGAMPVLARTLLGIVLWTGMSGAPSAQAQDALPQRPAGDAAVPLPGKDAVQIPATKEERATQEARSPEGEPAVERTTPATEAAKSAEPLPQRQPAAKALPRDLSPWGMFQAADIVIKAVMVGLAIASFVTWTVWLAKAAELWDARWRLRGAIRAINAAQTLRHAVDAFAQARGTGAALVREAAEEVVRSAPALDHVDGQGIKERLASRLSRLEATAARRMTLGTGMLATIGATAPFVGLFGTVWGIMNSFIGISQSQTTNLAVVAPGIAEALLATALGLVTAIPAVIIYNIFARSIAGYRLLLADASAGVERLVSWELDARRIPLKAAPTGLSRAAE